MALELANWLALEHWSAQPGVSFRFGAFVFRGGLPSLLGTSQHRPDADHLVMTGDGEISSVSAPLHGPDGVWRVDGMSTPHTPDTLGIVLLVLLLGCVEFLSQKDTVKVLVLLMARSYSYVCGWLGVSWFVSKVVHWLGEDLRLHAFWS